MVRLLSDVLLDSAQRPYLWDMNNRNGLEHVYKRARVILLPDPSVLDAKVARLAFSTLTDKLPNSLTSGYFGYGIGCRQRNPLRRRTRMFDGKFQSLGNGNIAVVMNQE